MTKLICEGYLIKYDKVYMKRKNYSAKNVFHNDYFIKDCFNEQMSINIPLFIEFEDHDKEVGYIKPELREDGVYGYYYLFDNTAKKMIFSKTFKGVDIGLNISWDCTPHFSYTTSFEAPDGSTICPNYGMFHIYSKCLISFAFLRKRPSVKDSKFIKIYDNEKEQNNIECCSDDRFKIIAKAKEDIINNTNIKTNKDEMKCLDSFLLRCWQMDWLKKYEGE